MDPVIISLIVILGASLGSFFNVLIDRLPRGVSFIRPRSHCTACQKPIPFWLNIPILSYMLLGGKCKYCKAKFHYHHFLVEVITPAVFVALFWKFGAEPVLYAKYVILCGFLIPIFFIDLYHHLILDKMTVPLAILGIIFALLPWTDITVINSLATGFGIVILLLGLAWVYEKVRKADGMGGGDIKLLGAMGFYLGVINISFIVLFSSLLAVLYAVVNRRNREGGVPYGPFLAIATVLWLLWGNLFLQWYFGIIFKA